MNVLLNVRYWGSVLVGGVINPAVRGRAEKSFP
jgi:hypothetical protein